MSTSQEAVADSSLEQSRDDTSQSNREKLYKRFKKLNTQGGDGGPLTSQIHSQKNLAQRNKQQQYPAEQKMIMQHAQQSPHQVAMQIRSSQPPSRSNNQNNLIANTAYVSPTESMGERLRRASYMPCQSPMNQSSSKHTNQTRQTQALLAHDTKTLLLANNDNQQLSSSNDNIIKRSAAFVQNQAAVTAQDQRQSSLNNGQYYSSLSSHLKDQFKRTNNSHGRNNGRAACSTSSVQKAFHGSTNINQDSSYNSNLMQMEVAAAAANLYDQTTITGCSHHTGQLRSEDRQKMSSRTLKQELSKANANQSSDWHSQQPAATFNKTKQQLREQGHPKQHLMQQPHNEPKNQKMLQYMSQLSSEQSSNNNNNNDNLVGHHQLQQYKQKQFTRMGNQTTHTSHTNLQKLNQQMMVPTTINSSCHQSNHNTNNNNLSRPNQQHQQRLMTTQFQQQQNHYHHPNNQTIISMQSDVDLNPLNDSRMFHVSNQQVRKYAAPHGDHRPPNSGLNQSSCCSQSNLMNLCGDDSHNYYFAGGENDMTQSNSSLWLNEELEAAQQEHRIRQSQMLDQASGAHRIQQHAQNKQLQLQLQQQQVAVNNNMQVESAQIGQQVPITRTAATAQRNNDNSHSPPDKTNYLLPSHQQLQQQQQWLQQQCQRAKGSALQNGGSIDLMNTQESELHASQLQCYMQQKGFKKPQYDPLEDFQSNNSKNENNNNQHQKMLNLAHLNLGKVGSNIDAYSCNSGISAATVVPPPHQRQQLQQHYSNNNNVYNTTMSGHQKGMTGRLSQQPSYPSHGVSDSHNSMRASFQGPLPSHSYNNQLHFGVLSDKKGHHSKRTERSQQVSIAHLHQASQLDERRRSSERNYPMMQTTHLGHSNTGGVSSTSNAYVDPNQSYNHHFERAKCSTRTNPYTNLLNSNCVGSTAPSANMDQMTASQGNSVSQFLPGNMTINAMTNTMPSNFGGMLNHQRGTQQVTQTLEGGKQHYNTKFYTTFQEAARHDNNDFDSSADNLTMMSQNPSTNILLTEGNFIGKTMSQADINAATISAQQAYTNQVAKSLLAQVRPGILKLIQSRVEAIVQELCDEGLYDQNTIMRVLEHRASQLFPESYMMNDLDCDNIEEQKDASGNVNQRQEQQNTSSDYRVLSSHHQPEEVDQNDLISQAQLTTSNNPGLFTSQANLSNNNEIPLDRSIYSDTMLTHTMEMNNTMSMMMSQGGAGAGAGLQQTTNKNTNHHHTLNLLQTLKEEQSLEQTSENFRSSDQRSSSLHQNNQMLMSYPDQQLAVNSFVTGGTKKKQQNSLMLSNQLSSTAAIGNRLNTTEKIINAMGGHPGGHLNQTKNNENSDEAEMMDSREASHILRVEDDEHENTGFQRAVDGDDHREISINYPKNDDDTYDQDDDYETATSCFNRQKIIQERHDRQDAECNLAYTEMNAAGNEERREFGEKTDENGQQQNNLNTDRLMNDIQDNSNASKIQAKGRNFNSRKLQKSDDFKITFAYQSKQSSMDMNPTNSSLGCHRAQNSSILHQQNYQQPTVLQVQEQNLISFNPNENQVQSPPAHSNQQIVDNIHNFTYQKQPVSSNNRTTTVPQEDTQVDGEQTDSQQLGSAISPANLVVSDGLAVNLIDLRRASCPVQAEQQRALTVENEASSVQMRTQSDIAKLYFQTTDQTVRSLPNARSGTEAMVAVNLIAAQQLMQQSRNNGLQMQEQSLGQHQQQQNLSCNKQQSQDHPSLYLNQKPHHGFNNSLLYQKTNFTEPEFEKITQMRMHMTQNSDLIDQIGQQINTNVDTSKNQGNDFVTEQLAPNGISHAAPTPNEFSNNFKHSNHPAAQAVFNSFQQFTNDDDFDRDGEQLDDYQFNSSSGHYQPTQTAQQHVPQAAATTTTATNRQSACFAPETSAVQDDFQIEGTAAGVEDGVLIFAQSRKASCAALVESGSRCLSDTLISQTVELTNARAANQTHHGSLYDVRAEGSIINIKHNNQAGGGEQGEQDDPKCDKRKKKKQANQNQKQQSQSTSRQRQKSNLNDSNQKQKSRSQSRKGASRKASKSKNSNQAKAQRPPMTKQTPRSVSCQRKMTGKIGIRQGNLTTLKEGKSGRKQQSITPERTLLRSLSARNNNKRSANTPLKIEKPKMTKLMTHSTKFAISPASVRLQRMQETEKHRRRLMTESKSLTCRSSNDMLQLDRKEMLGSIKYVCKESIQAKRQLKALYDHKVQKLRDDMLAQKRRSDKQFKQKLKFQTHATKVHQNRAENFKATAEELVHLADIQRHKNQELIVQLSNQRAASRQRKSSFGQHYSRSNSNKRSASCAQGQTSRFALGSSFEPGFSFISKSLPRNNHNFTKNDSLAYGKTQNQNKSRTNQVQPNWPVSMISTSKNYHNKSRETKNSSSNSRSRPTRNISSLYESAMVVDNNNNSLQQRPQANADTSGFDNQNVKIIGSDTVEIEQDLLQSMKRYEQQKDLKLISADLEQYYKCPMKTQINQLPNGGLQLGQSADLSVRIAHRADIKSEEEENYVEVDQRLDSMNNPLNSRTTFGIDQMHDGNYSSMNLSERSFEGGSIVKNHRSLFDAASKTLLSVKSREEATATPLRTREQANEERKKKFVQELQQSGARIKCKVCKTSGRNIQVQLPCATCQNQNCHADQTDQKEKQRGKHLRKNGSMTTDVTWNSEDLNTEYQDSHRNGISKKNRNAISNKLIQCSNDLIANQARLDQIQKILFQPRNKQPRQGAKPERQVQMRQPRHETISSAGHEEYYENSYASATLPQMIDRLRKSRQNLKF